MREAVVDASVVVEMLAGDAEAALAILAPFDELHAPAHLDVECLSALRRLLLGGRDAPDGFLEQVAALGELPITRHNLAPLLPRMASLAYNATPYASAYIALAEGLDVPLLTADTRIASVPGITCQVMVF
jgi:predicted nucleic acid-binding protein